MSVARYINVLERGGFMKKCSRCRRLKAKFVADHKGRRGVGDVCKQCDVAVRAPHPRTEAKPETTKRPEAPRRPGRPNEGSVWLRSGVWQVTVTVDGKTRKRSSRSSERAVAEALRDRLLGCAETPGQKLPGTCAETAEPSQNLPTGDLKEKRRRA